ncbi:MAG TPA: hypothetical protein VN605_00535, partial [Thermoanaerobaculia bacterium]|nr:hypothetical protein [Thermoanaerobaculia bacterium]
MSVREGRSSFRTIALLMLLPIAGLGLILSWSFLQNALHTPASGKHVVATRASVMAPAAKPAAAEPPPPSKKKAAHRTGNLVVILDDVG